MEERTLPYALDAEKAVLGACLLGNGPLTEAAARLKPEDFFRDAHKRLFAAMLRLTEAGVPPDLITIADELRKGAELDECGGLAYITSLTDGVPRTANISYYAIIVREKARLRALIQAFNAGLVSAYDSEQTSADISDTVVRALASASDGATPQVITVEQAVTDYIDTLIQGQAEAGIRSGFADLDGLLGGFQPGDLVIIAARPSVGKTTLALNMARRMAEAGTKAAIFSLEMASRQLAAQLLSSRGRVDVARFRHGWARDDDYARMTEAASALAVLPIVIDDASTRLSQVWGWCRKLKDEGKLGAVFVDYLQLLVPAGVADRERQAVDDISRGLKRIARELKVPVIALSQLTRAPESRQDRRPHASDLRGSGALEQDTDTILLLYREDMHDPSPENEGIAEVIIAKNRSGPVGVIRLAFIKQYAAFEDLARGD